MCTTTHSNKKRGNVYVLQNEKKRYKIGNTKNDVRKRVKQLQTGSDEELIIVYSRLFDDCAAAEITIHTIFAAQRKRGEWFSLSRQDKELLHKIFTLQGLTSYDRESLQRLKLL